MAGIVLTGCASRTYDDIEPQDQEVGTELVVYTEVKLV